jgi:2-iminobutanoate/2-iminopropanoate deaminase
MERQIIKTEKAAAPVGPYSQGIKAGGFVFVAGEKGIDPVTNKIVPGGVPAETRQMMKNVQVILEQAGSSLENIVRSTVYLTNINDFGAFNEVYKNYFPEGKAPVRTTVAVVSLPAGAALEIECTAIVP